MGLSTAPLKLLSVTPSPSLQLACRIWPRKALRLVALVFFGGATGLWVLADKLPAVEGPGVRPGGDTTVAVTGRHAFSFPAANLDPEAQSVFASGSLIFRRDWVQAPTAIQGKTVEGLGLGPHFNERSCSGCHSLDGRGAPHAAGDLQRRFIPVQPFALVFRLAVPGAGGKLLPEPRYGQQFSNSAVSGVRPEGEVHISYTETPGRFADGSAYSLRQPRYRFSRLAYGPLHPQTVVSPRIAPHLPGVGLLDAVSEGDIEQNARDQARRGDAIRGIVSRVFDPFGGEVVGRFGWKASTGSLQHQTAAAFLADIGITSEHFAREDCTPAQADCLQAQRAQGVTPSQASSAEIDNETFGKVVAYQATLAVPARRDLDNPAVRRGQALFAQAQCSACHRPAYTTAKGYGPALSRQSIYPYTDLLLHDMGPGLADRLARGPQAPAGLPELAGMDKGNSNSLSKHWRTPPLWGIGLFPEVNGHAFLLHDGRARGVLEAILWHGGEAEGSRQKVLAMTRSEREALVKFVNSL